MEIHYPKGTVTQSYTQAKKKAPKKLESAANRGMSFEDDINQSNEYYIEKKLAIITKRPTPIKVLKVDYTKGAHITSAVYEKQSTTDYNGVIDGHYVDFEAKSTRSKTSFPLSNIAPQQIVHLKRVLEAKGIAFFLIQFALLDETYLLPASYVISFYEEKPRASIPLKEIQAHGHLVKEGYRPRYDYLPLVRELFLK